MKTTYQHYYTRWYKNQTVIDNHRIETIRLRNKLHEITYSPTNRILDIACGISVFGKTFGDNVYGIDLNPQAVIVARKNGIKATIGNVEKKWNFPDKYFNIVIISHIIEHVVSPDHLLQETKRVLKKNGLIIVITPNLAAWFNRLLLALGFQPFFTEVSTMDKTLGLKFTRSLGRNRSPIGHLRVFTLKALRDILELYGFQIVKTGGTEFGNFPPLLSYIDKLFAQTCSLAACIFVIAKKS